MSRISTAVSGSERAGRLASLPVWLVIAATALFSVGATAGIGWLRTLATERMSGSGAASDLAASVYNQSALEWSAIAVGDVSSETREDLVAAREEADVSLAHLRSMGAADGLVAGISDTNRALTSAVDAELRLVVQGRMRAAVRVDEEEVDPAFEQLHSSIALLKAKLDSEAASAIRYSGLGSLALGLLAALTTGGLFAMYSRRRREADLLAGERVGLLEGEGKYRTLLESSSEVIAVVSQQRSIDYVSPSVERVLGKRAEDVLGKPIGGFVNETDWAQLERSLAVAGTMKPTSTRRMRAVRSDGTDVLFEATVRDLFSDEFVGGIALNFRDVTEEARLQEELKHQAFHDPLTGLPNRKLFHDRIDHALLRSRREPDEELAVLFLDLDGFKEINDRFGHGAGDEVLGEVARRLVRRLREGDTLARLGGDEFGVLLESVDRTAQIEIAERLLGCLSKPVLVNERHTVPVRMSIGIAEKNGTTGTSEDLLREADLAMYQAKRDRLGSYRIFDEALLGEARRRSDLQVDLRLAVEAEQIQAHFQPIYRLDPPELVGVEALARWEHPELGMIPPSEFIPLAEESGLIIPLGRQVLDRALSQLETWNLTLGRSEPLKCGVNFSASQLSHPSFVADVSDAIERHGVQPDQLVIEITESELMQDPEDITKKLKQLRAMGVVFAIDDFGTGYSSLNYLRSFPVRILKMDRAFVKGISVGTEASAFAKAIVRLAHSLGFDVVAEGIETETELKELLEAGCNFGQGFLLGRPIPATDLQSQLIGSPILPEQLAASLSGAELRSTAPAGVVGHL